MSRPQSIVRLAAALIAVVALTSTAGAAMAEAPEPRTNATYYNDAQFNAADPFVMYDEASGYYYAYSTDGATRVGTKNFLFGIYRSADLVTWEHVPGGAIPADEPNRWGRDWFWAPAVYHNEETGKYFLFYSARQRDNVERDFGYASFEEPSKVGVAVSDSPAGPFHSIANHPIDYFPYDPDYHDVNLIMDSTQRKPPATLEEGMTAPRGTYIPFIDPDVFFDSDGRIYLYFSRNAYRNWVWDEPLGKYIEESNIYAVELTADWWNDPTGSTLPAVAPSYVNANKRADAPAESRRDGYVPILSQGADPQPWEDAHVNDYATSGGARKDRRWEEGSTTFVRHVDTDGDGVTEPVYYLLYSANNWENAFYGVGYATSDSPLGPFTKHAGNPILSQDPGVPISGTGHGDLAFSPDGSEAFYVHHGRPTTGPRKLYTSRLLMDGLGADASGAPVLDVVESASDTPVPSGVRYAVEADDHHVVLSRGRSAQVSWRVTTPAGAALPLSNPLNRVVVTVDRPDVVGVEVSGGTATLTNLRPGSAELTLAYERRTADGSYVPVTTTVGGRTTPVTDTVRVVTNDGEPDGGTP